MKKLLIVAIVCLPTLALAQPAAGPEVTLKVTAPELDIISEGLVALPFAKVVQLVNKLRQQVIDQQPKPVAPPVAEPPK